MENVEPDQGENVLGYRALTKDEEQRLDRILSGRRTSKNDRIMPLSSEEAARMLKEAAGIMDRAKACLAQYRLLLLRHHPDGRQNKEARLIIQEIDEWTLRT